jgi:hypothetical protein
MDSDLAFRMWSSRMKKHGHTWNDLVKVSTLIPARKMRATGEAHDTR